MNKELEEIKSIVAIHFGALGFLNPSENEQILKDRDKVLNALSELQSIKDTNPSEALKDLEELGTYRIEYREPFELGFTKSMPFKNTIEFKIIKQALIKAQELEKVLSIIKKKNVDVFRFKKLDFNTFNQLQKSCRLPELTQEEYELLRRLLG